MRFPDAKGQADQHQQVSTNSQSPANKQDLGAGRDLGSVHGAEAPSLQDAGLPASPGLKERREERRTGMRHDHRGWRDTEINGDFHLGLFVCLFCVWATPIVLRQGLLLALGLRDLMGCRGSNPGGLCTKASALTAALSLWPPKGNFWRWYPAAELSLFGINNQFIKKDLHLL